MLRFPVPDNPPLPIWPLEATEPENTVKSNSVMLVQAWRLNDLKIADDAKSFWHQLRALPPSASPEQRAKELCATAYLGNELVGVSTIRLENFPRLRCRIAVFRCLVSPQHAHRRIAKNFHRLFTWPIRALVSAQSGGKGPRHGLYSTILPNFELLRTRPVWRLGNNAYYWLIGYTPDGKQIRLSWFTHARVE